MEKYHRQFGHANENMFVTCMKDIKAWQYDLDKHFEKNSRGGCNLKKINPYQPVVTFPKVNSSNEKVPMDPEHWKEHGDMYSYNCKSLALEYVCVVAGKESPIKL